MGQNRFVHLLFACASLIMAVLVYKASDWVWGTFAKPSEFGLDAIGLGAGLITAILLFRNKKVFGIASEIGAELKKVTWPTRQETYQNTVVVVITVLVSAALLGVFDLVWSGLTAAIYG